MDPKMSGEVLDASEAPQQKTGMEKEVASKLETPEEPTEPEKPAAAEEQAVNGHETEGITLKETEELIVIENATLPEDKKETKAENSLPKEKSDTESMPSAEATPEPDESSEKISDPVAALNTEPENAKQQAVPENDPEPLQARLAESTPEPEPEKLAESVTEAQLKEQTSPESTVTLQPVDKQPPSQEDKVSEQVETERGTTMATGEAEVSKESGDGAMPKVAEVEPIEKAVGTADSSEMPTETATSKEEASAETGNVKPAEDEKEVKSESDTLKGAEAAAGEVVKSDDELQKEEDPAPASGSLSFALFEREQTKDALLISRTLIVLRGLPGSGKSFLARAIADAYKDHCTVICADDHGIKPENPDSCADGYKALDEAVVARCSDGTSSSVLIVVDDTSHTQDRLARLGQIAEQHHLVALFLEPQTEWSRDVAQLSKKTRRGLEVVQLEAMKCSLEEMSLPLFFGWFLLSSVQDKVRCTSMDFLKTLDTLEAFKKHSLDFTGKAEKEVDLEQYFEAKGALHCTTKFCNYGKAEGCKEYAQNPAVRELYGSAFELSLSALFVTPRTVGARVSLTEEQLLLWPADSEKQPESAVPAAASLPLGSRAHLTLGCAEGVEPVQTGLDLLEILALQQEGQQGELVEEMELGSLTYYGEGRWLLSLREPICAPACFSSFYGPRELEVAKKEPEKKKKPKCTIL
ncbi:2',3'-cyclic-nucleotide 3'-phosphodiesterase [Embiotoca jacksoni]|uniref:2',3'-cyclic-nucleotide 3'-phosphodiesterase n=1 Tax=Embiotoca jacksoni TaxID=100190 RepID=UPI0037047772